MIKDKIKTGFSFIDKDTAGIQPKKEFEIQIKTTIQFMEAVIVDFLPIQEKIKMCAERITKDTLSENISEILTQVNKSLSLLHLLQHQKELLRMNNRRNNNE